MSAPEPRLDENDKALERMKQERESPGRDTLGGDASSGDFEGTDPRRGDSVDERPARPNLPPKT